MLALLGLGGAALVVLPHASASAVPDTTPALAATGPESMSLVWRDATPDRLHDQESTALGRWSDPADFTTPRPLGETSGVGAGADPESGEVLAATVADDQVWVRTGTRGAWSDLGGSATGAPAVAGLGGGVFAVVVRDDDGAVHVRYRRGGAWSRWFSLGGKLRTSPAAAGRGGHLVIAAAGRNREIRTTVVTGEHSTGWHNTRVVSTATPGLAAEPGTGTLHLITRNPDLTPSARVSADGGRTWGGATRLNGRLGSGIAATSRGSGTVDIAALSLGGQVVQSSLRAGAWGEFRLVTATSTTVLPEDAVSTVSGDPAGTRTIRLAAGVPLPKPGDILAATSTPATPDGLLVKVVSAAGRTVEAGPAKLTEAIPRGTISETFTLGTGDGPLVQPIRKNMPCGPSARAEVSGSVSITPSFALDASWSPLGGVENVSFTGSLTQDAQLRTTISGNATCTLKTVPLSEPIRFQPVVVHVGPVPIVITPQLQVYLDASGSVQAALETAAGQTTSVEAGLAYRDGASVSPVSGGGSTFTYQQPTVNGTATAQAGVSPAVNFLIYGVPGPRLSTRSTVRIDATAPRWTLTAGLTAGVDLVVPQLGVDQRRKDIISNERVIATGAGTPPAGTRTAGRPRER